MECLAVAGQAAFSASSLISSSSGGWLSGNPSGQQRVLPTSSVVVLVSKKLTVLKTQAGCKPGPTSCCPDRSNCTAASPLGSAFLGRSLRCLSSPSDDRSGHKRRPAIVAEAAKEGGTKETVLPTPDKNGVAKVPASSADETVESLRAALVAAELRAAKAEKDKLDALEAAAVAEAKAEAYGQNMVTTTEEAMAEVESAKSIFKAELEKLVAEKTVVEEQLAEAKLSSIDLAVKVEKLANIAVHEATAQAAEEAKLRLAEAEVDAVTAASEVEGRIRRAADEAAAAVIAEAKATIADALAAADMAKEQARAAEAALKQRMGVLDELGRAEADVMKAQETIADLEAKRRIAQAEIHQLQMEVKAALARAQAAESRVGSNEFALKEIQEAHEKATKEREEATRHAIESMKVAAAVREEAAMLAYKAETDSLRAALVSAQNAEKVKEQAMQRRFDALERSLRASEDVAKAWKARALTLESLLKTLKERGSEALQDGGGLEDILNGGRMDVMLGDPKVKRKLLAEGPRRERPEWLKRKSTAGVRLPPLKVAPLDTPVIAEIPLELPAPDKVWSIADHQLLDDIFTREVQKREEEQRDLEEQRTKLEQALQRKTRRVKSPEDLEDKLESGTGTGREIVFQAFNWESWRRKWYLELAPKAADMAACGITTIWLPPPTESVAPQGYMPVDLYNLNSAYGTMEELKFCIEEMHNHDIQVLGDVVLNHRCASKQSPNGIWNIFGGKLAWGPEAIVRDDPNFQGQGHPSMGDIFHAAPNIDHSQEFVRQDIKEWLCWLRAEVGYDGWRLDFARGFWGGHVKEYIEASKPAFCIGEYWDSLGYEGNAICYNQDAHRQRIINWINATGGTSSAFDVTTKGILHQALHNEYWRLIDPQGKPPGVMGWWPSRAVTFLENHDTGSTQAHWPFPRDKLMQGYAYILTHPGTPVVFYDHFYEFGLHDQVAELLAARTRCGIHCRSLVKILLATAEGYVAQVGENLVVKLGGVDWNPSKQNDLVGRWERFMDHGMDYQLWEKR